MSRPLRNTNAEYIRLYTIRTFEQRFFMRPSEEVNQIIGGVMARYKEKHGIEIFAYTVLSNHIHILLRAPNKNLWKFAQEINREIAQRINRFIGRSGFFWGRRYDEQICLKEEDALEALLYISCNPVSHGLVRYAKNWPGISSYRYGVVGEEKTFLFTHFTKYKEAKRKAKSGERVKLSDYQTKHKLELTKLPMFSDLDRTSYRDKLATLIHEREAELISRREESGLSFLGRKGVLEQQAFARPKNPKKSPRPICYTKCFEAKKIFMSWYFFWWNAYKRASERLRSGFLDASFPEFCLKPPLHC